MFFFFKEIHKSVWVVVSIHSQLVPASIIQWMLNDISSGLFDAQS